MSTPPFEHHEAPPGGRRKLYRSRRDRMIAGVAGGVAEYFNVDPVLLRVAMVALLIFTAVLPAVVFYIACIFIIPSEP